MSDIRVSAIVTTYQLERYVTEAIASIQAQTRPVDEIVVVDNGSTDSTVAIVRGLSEHDPRIALIHEESKGPVFVRNCGLRAARGDVIAFLDGDDVWPKTKIANQLAMLQTSPGLQVTTGQTAMVRAIDPMTLEPPPTATMASAIHVNVGASLYRRSVFDELGGFDARFRYAEDYDLMFRIRDSGMKMASTDAVTLYYRMHENSLTASDHDRQMRDITLAVGLSRQRRRRLGLPAPTHFYGRPAWLARCASPQS